MRNRYYDPTTGRFTQEDPIGLAGRLNVYGFGNGNPVTYSDPYGLYPCPPDNDCGWLTLGLTVTGAAIGGGIGFLAGRLCGPAAPACSPAAATGGALKGAAILGALGTSVGLMMTASGRGGSGDGDVGGSNDGGADDAAAAEARAAGRFARQNHLSPNHPAVTNRSMKVQDFIGKFRQGRFRSQMAVITWSDRSKKRFVPGTRPSESSSAMDGLQSD